MIRSRFNEKVITLLNGDIVLEKPGSLGTYRWRCVENMGWLGFQDPASANYMGYNEEQRIRCAVDKHYDWEYFSPRKLPDGGYAILTLVEDKKTLLPIGIYPLQAESGVSQKVMIRDWRSEGIAWDFIEVQG
jgi:hypothetical protein